MQKITFQRVLGVSLITSIFGLTQWSVLARIQLTQGIRINEERLAQNPRLKDHYTRALKRSEWAKRMAETPTNPKSTIRVSANSKSINEAGIKAISDRPISKSLILPDLDGADQNQVWKVLQFIEKSVETENQEVYSTMMRGLDKLKKQNSPLFQEYCKQLVEHLRIFKRVNGRPDEYFATSDRITRNFINEHLPEWSFRIAEMEFMAKTETL